MSEFGNLGIFDRVLEVMPGPIYSHTDTGIAYPSTVQIVLSNDSDHVQLVLTSEAAARLVKALRAHVPNQGSR